MKVIKSINNNIAICLDNNNHQLIVFGKGIGFPKMPYELNDLSKIESTFYDVDPKYYDFFTEVSEETLLFVQYMIEKIKMKSNYIFNPNIIFVLADHIEFAVKRSRSNTYVPLPYSYDIEYEYPEFVKISKWMVKNIEKKFEIHLQEGEVNVIALHLIESLQNDRVNHKKMNSASVEKIVHGVTNIINDCLKTTIDKNSYNYIRFKTHMKYLIKRLENKAEFRDDNFKLLSDMRKNFPEIDYCVTKISDYLNEYFQTNCTASEVLYLFIHVNRLYTREGCNQPGKTSERNK